MSHWCQYFIECFLHLIKVTEFIHILRVPLLGALFLLVFPWIAMRKARPLLSGLFDIEEINFKHLVLATVATGSVIFSTGSIIFLQGHDRVPGVLNTNVSAIPGWVPAIILGVLSLPTICTAVLYSHRHGHRKLGKMLRSALWGTVIVVLIALLVNDIHRISKFYPPQFLPLGIHHGIASIRDRFIGLVGPFAQDFCSSTAVSDVVIGYLKSHGSFSVDAITGHLLAAIVFILVLGFYAVIGWRKAGAMGRRTTPALVYLLLLVMLLCSVLSALTFFLDRYHIPVLLTAGMMLFLSAKFRSSDHFFRVIEKETLSTSPSPAETIRAHGRDTAIVVGVNGGGIQAAAWGVRVLTGLELVCRESDLPDKLLFSKSVRVLSSVSGGSVGAMYFVRAYDTQTGSLVADNALLEEVVDIAKESSLDDVGWGLVYPDLLRLVFPFLIKTTSDRGSALEKALARNGAGFALERELTQKEVRLSGGCEGARTSTFQTWYERGLSDFYSEVREGRRPAMIINATITESGHRLLMGTSELKPEDPTQSAPIPDGRVNFSELGQDYQKKDLPLVTAVRLSAAFPFASPAARADINTSREGEPHIVDGGYYDNYGMASLVEWLDEALRNAPEIKRVLVLQIRGAKTTSSADKALKKRGWFYQALAPFVTLLNVRTAGQLSHNHLELSLLQQAWQDRGKEIKTVVFEFDPGENSEEPPLSWHMTKNQKDVIEEVWKKIDRQRLLEVVDFLRGSKDINCPTKVAVAKTDQRCSGQFIGNASQLGSAENN